MSTVAKIRKPVGSAKIAETKRQYFLSWDATVPSLTLANAHRLVQHLSSSISLPQCGRKGLWSLGAPQPVSVLLKLSDLLAVLQIVMTGHGQTRHVQKSWEGCSSAAASWWCLMPKTSWLQWRCIAALILKHAPVSGPLQASIPIYYWGPHLSYIPPFFTPFPFAFICQHVIVNLEERRAVVNE